MVKSKKYDIPKTDKSSGINDINNAVVDSGLRIGYQTYEFTLRQQVTPTPDVIDLDTNSNGLSIDVGSTTISVPFNTDTATTISDFATAVEADAIIESAKIIKSTIQITVIENNEVLLSNALVTGATKATVAHVELTGDLRVIPAVVTIPAEPQALRVDEPTASVTYTGYAVPGSAEGDPVWLIKKVEKVGNVTSIGYPDASTLSDKTWSGRTGYTYS